MDEIPPLALLPTASDEIAAAMQPAAEATPAFTPDNPRLMPEV